jgi:serine/threonine protein kinase
MRKKPGVDLAAYFPRADAGALALLRRLLAFDPSDRPSAEEALADPYFHNLHSPAREPSAQVRLLTLAKLMLPNSQTIGMKLCVDAEGQDCLNK